MCQVLGLTTLLPLLRDWSLRNLPPVPPLISIPAADIFFPSVDTAVASDFPCALRVARALQKPSLPPRLSLILLLPRRAFYVEPIPPRSLIRSHPPFAPGDPVPPTAMPLTGRLSTRTSPTNSRWRCASPPADNYAFGAGGPPRPSARRGNSPPRFSWPRPPLAIVMAPVPAASRALTVPILSVCDRVEPVKLPY